MRDIGKAGIGHMCLQQHTAHRTQAKNLPVRPERGWTSKDRKTGKAIAKLFYITCKRKNNDLFRKIRPRELHFLRAAFMKAFVYGNVISN